MRIGLTFAPLLLIAAPVSAQVAPNDIAQMQREIADPTMINQTVDMVKNLSGAMLTMPVGDIEAAAEGRKPTPMDHRRTVASETGMTPQGLQSRIDAARPMILRSIDALAKALPAMTKGLTQVQQAVERAAANMPDPNYPRR